MKKVIVTGGAGFIGSHIVDALVDLGYEVHIVDNMSSGNPENVNPKATLHTVDIRDGAKLSLLFAGATYVFHEAASLQVQYSMENPVETNDINVNGLLNVLEASRINKVKRVIFASSCAVYGDQATLPLVESMEPAPLSPYGAQKYMGEVYMKLYSQIYGLETVCLRYFNVYGKRQSVSGAYRSVVATFEELLKNGKPLTVTGDGKQTRSFVNVLDIAKANILAMEGENIGKGEIINIATNEQSSINEIARLVGGEVVFIPPRVEPRAASGDIHKAKELLGWEPSIELSEGIIELKKYNNI